MTTVGPTSSILLMTLSSICSLAEQHRAKSNCSECSRWWTQPRLAPRSQDEMAAALALSQQRGTPSPRTAWFMCIVKPNITREHAYATLVQAAILSARLHAPSLAPYILYVHRPSQVFATAEQEQADELASWLRSQGVTVVNHRITFFAEIPRHLNPTRMVSTTGLCKLDVPAAAHRLRAELLARRLDPSRVLVTDADVLFAGDWSYPDAVPLDTFAAGSEILGPSTLPRTSLNSGVLYINVSSFLREWEGMRALARRRKYKFIVADQTWLHQYYGRRWSRLDDALYNARPFYHPRPEIDERGRGVHPQAEPRIWHWHGYKPGDVSCWVSAMLGGRWPERAWRKPNCQGRASLCAYRPIRGSGCRHFGRIRPAMCYLRTYLYLLEEHAAFVRLAQRASKSV